MSSATLAVPRAQRSASRAARWALIATALGFLALMLIVPVAAVLVEALRDGWRAWGAALVDPDVLAAVRLTLLTAAIVVPVNTLFGLAAAWTVTRFELRGRSVWVTLIDVPFAVSPVIAGLIFLQLFGARTALGGWLRDHGVEVLFSIPGVVIATLFVTSPFVARELIAFMESQGRDEEEAAAILGASGWQTFLRVTLPRIRWALLYGVVLCASRSIGEFGAVSVVSGHIRGETNTLPLEVEILYDEYQFSAAFAAASLLMLMAACTTAAARFAASKTKGEIV